MSGDYKDSSESSIIGCGYQEYWSSRVIDYSTYLSSYDVLFIGYESATDVWRNLTVRVSLLVVFKENIQ